MSRCSNLIERYENITEGDKSDDYKEYFKDVMKNSSPTDTNIKRHFGKEELKPLADLVVELSKKYKVGMDGNSIVGPLKDGSISIKMTSDGKLLFVSVDNFKDGSGYSKKLKSNSDVISIFKKLA